MSRSFRLINAELDPDSVVFLGDLFDGGREWAPGWGRSLSVDEKIYLYNLGVIVEPQVQAPAKSRVEEGDFNERLERLKELWQIEARQPGKSSDSQGIRSYAHGEEGRWKKWGNEQWATEMRRFAKIFFAPGQLYPRSSRSLLSTTERWPSAIGVDNGAENSKKQAYTVLGHKQRKVVSNLPGNHDVGFGSGVQLSVRNRFQGFFGDGNDLYVLGNHTFLSLDTPSLSAYSEFTFTGETNKEEREKTRFIWEPTYQFLDNLQNLSKPVVGAALSEIFTSVQAPSKDAGATSNGIVKRESSQAQLPVVLLSHVPFFRDQGTDCGPLREKGKAIHVSAGYQYQNVLTQELTTHIVERVSSSIGDIKQVFSGDDHDYCDVSFSYDISRAASASSSTPLWRSVRDITVKSFSWAMGVRKPGFLLVSLWNPIDTNGKNIEGVSQTIQTKSCLLPDQLSIFIRYASLFGFTLAFLLARAIIIALRGSPDDDASSSSSAFRSFSLGRSNSGKGNGFSAPSSSNVSKSHGRHRASSTSTSNNAGGNNPEKLSVQRSYNARTRSISPMPLGETFTHIASMAKNVISQNPSSSQHLSPQVHWDLDGHSDLESQVSEYEDYDDRDDDGDSGSLLKGNDSQAKWKRKPRRTTKARRALGEFVHSLGWVALPCAVLYAGLIWNG
jgi:hypothetical protein